MRRAIISTVVGLAAVLLIAASASANGWCRTDPKVGIDGHVVNIFISMPDSSSADYVVAATQVKITVPVGTDHSLLDIDDGFGFGYNVAWVESPWMHTDDQGVPVKISVYVPAQRSIPVQVEWQAHGADVTARAFGTTNGWVTLRTSAH